MNSTPAAIPVRCTLPFWNIIHFKETHRMILWDNIFGTAYNYYGRFKNQSQRFSATCIVSTSIMTLAMLLIIILSKILGRNILSMAFPHKYYIIPVVFVLIYFVNRHYSVSRVGNVMTKFNSLTSTQKDFWKFLTVIFFVGPIVLIAFLLKK